jgi:hypothetical protein
MSVTITIERGKNIGNLRTGQDLRKSTPHSQLIVNSIEQHLHRRKNQAAAAPGFLPLPSFEGSLDHSRFSERKCFSNSS